MVGVRKTQKEGIDRNRSGNAAPPGDGAQAAEIIKERGGRKELKTRKNDLARYQRGVRRNTAAHTHTRNNALAMGWEQRGKRGSHEESICKWHEQALREPSAYTPSVKGEGAR
jgi:hypothetical protein